MVCVLGRRNNHSSRSFLHPSPSVDTSLNRPFPTAPDLPFDLKSESKTQRHNVCANEISAVCAPIFLYFFNVSNFDSTSLQRHNSIAFLESHRLPGLKSTFLTIIVSYICNMKNGEWFEKGGAEVAPSDSGTFSLWSAFPMGIRWSHGALLAIDFW